MSEKNNSKKNFVETLHSILKLINSILVIGAVLGVIIIAALSYFGKPAPTSIQTNSPTPVPTEQSVVSVPTSAPRSADSTSASAINLTSIIQGDLSGPNTVFILADKSRGTAYDGQIEFERELISKFVTQMNPEDLISVIGFDSTPFVLFRPIKVFQILSALDYRLKNLVSMGKTDLLPALELVCKIIPNIKSNNIQIVVITDGKIPITGEEYLEMLKKVTKLGAKISTVALGNEPDEPFLKMLSELGKGIYIKSKESSEVVEKLLTQFKMKH